MKIRALIVSFALLLVAFVAPPAQAHHSAVSWDLTRRISVTGTVQSFEWRNPHGHLEVKVVADGKETVWNVETSALNLLVRRGWKVDAVKVGDKVTITGHPHKSDPTEIYMREMQLPDGTSFGDPTGKDQALD